MAAALITIPTAATTMTMLPVTLDRVHESVDRFEGDERPDHEQGDPVRLGGQNLCTLQPERPGARRRTPGEPEGRKGGDERTGVGEHVAGICEQGQRVAHEGKADLERHEDRDEDQAEHDIALVASGRQSVLLVAWCNRRDPRVALSKQYAAEELTETSAGPTGARRIEAAYSTVVKAGSDRGLRSIEIGAAGVPRISRLVPPLLDAAEAPDCTEQRAR